ncbi:U3 small nucleolar RNA-associated protein 14 homolog A [Coccinella septempunctata]|uniref:U3 small nucleolar RNA-associated protein 14 homolog A n=1 Tax=Coccinella septempunctata TaxID=41139 RepID=UPI001D06C8CD|nr:U3 small nucleolar RNA-associated protein 14 homolog A [Coccinella septempunctata]
MGLEDEDFVHSDDDFDDKKHEKLLDKILTINKTQQLKKASRTEPALQISEFDLAKSITGKKGVIHVGDLTSILQKKKTHVAIKKKVDNTSKITTTLPKPLEKPLANQINRTVAYEKTRLELDRWEPIITANRVSTDLLFPLPTRENDKNVDLTKKWTLKTDFDIELEKNHPELVEEIHVETEQEKVKLTLGELKERRGKLAEYRAKLSYQEAKARRQNKIKSKKYHRIQKKAKIKQQLKEFEELKKTKPEEALRRLEEIERIRAQERFSLRHKGTGKWAKHKQIHAKYDKDSRAELAQQLRLSKELTQKVNANSDSEDEFKMPEDDGSGTKNTILWSDDKLKSAPEVTDFINDYTNFYIKKAAQTDANPTEDQNEENSDEGANNKETENNTVEVNISEEEIEESCNTQKEKLEKKNTKKVKAPTQGPAKKKSKKRKRASLNVSSTSDWDVELVDDNIDVIFDELEKKMDIKLRKEASKIEKQLAPQKSSKKKRKGDENYEEKESLLALPMERLRPQLDEPLLQTSNGNEIPEGELSDLSNILKKKNLNIDKNQVLPTQNQKSSNSKKKEQKQVINLDSILPDITTNMDEDEDDFDDIQQQLKEEAAECFEDDLVQQFAKEKAETIENDKPKDLSLFLPGWGSWGGVGIVPSKRKRRRFVLKAPKKVPRRDDNKGFLIINEDADKKVKEHMVDELPFPFQRVQDFEESIRAPIGRTFVPETAFRRLTKPAVKTKIGTIIEPMDKDVLLKKSNF